MTSRKLTSLAAGLCIGLMALLPAAASGAAKPAWTLVITPMPANFSAVAAHKPEYMLNATNVGGGSSSGQVLLKATLPAGLRPLVYSATNSDFSHAANPTCEIVIQEVTCETTEAVGPGYRLLVQITVEVTAAAGTYSTEAAVSGGGANQSVSTTLPTRVQEGPLGFDFLSNFSAPTTTEDGTPATLAGSHSYQQTIAFGLPTENPGKQITNSGHPRNLHVELPRGMVGDPAASPMLCTEAQLTGSEGCPDASQVGLADITSLVGEVGINAVITSNLYNMVPPPGTPAELATNVASVGVFVHVLTSVRSDDDYGLEATTPDIIAFGQQPIFGIEAQVWGDPSAEAHDHIRGTCSETSASCPVEPQKIALLTMPGDCPAEPLSFEVHADTWEEPFPQFEEHRALYESADLTGSPVSVEGCSELKFEPSTLVRPTTNRSDSPSGLDFTLHQPQEGPHEEPLSGQATATLKDAAIFFPAGLAVNPAQAAGLGACTEDQIGFEEETEGGRLDFSKQPQSCPNAAKIGTLEVTSPALVARNEEHEVEKDLEEHPVLEPLHGSVYIASPFANPFESLVAVYLVVEDEKTGIVAKLAGEGELDPQTGQITTYFEENPELPLEDIDVHIFGGDRGAFITPPTCGKYTTESDFTPWSSPEGQDAFPESSFQTTQAPGGGSCPTTQAQLLNNPKLNAGTESPAAGAYSPLLFKVSREDGTQRLAKIEATLPTGLSAKLAGVVQCSEADIAKARSREEPEKGALEQADPSCPAAAEIGVVNAAAGAGPTPYYTQGHAYLAGPYKGAPLSIVAIAPAIAGPFDLGTVVVRSALYLDPETAQGRIVSDPLPTILDGVPLDVRSVAVRAGRQGFSLNPTSCAEKSFGGSAISTLGSAAPLSERFQVGGCKSLPYKPKLTANLYGPIHRGGHPRLRTVFTARPGDANTARISFALPSSEFIDQAHFRTICTRVQFAANQCPAGSTYGHVKATSPLVDYTVEGPIYLRSSAHKLPDVVAALRGPPSQPIEVDLDGRVDSVNGGIRTTFETVPDLPVTKAIVTLQGGKKGLFQNSTNICKGTHRATLKLDAQSGKASDTKPLLKAQCGKGSKKHLHRK
jgi:hypothetical protein